VILPPPGFAQPIPDPSLRPLLEQEFDDILEAAIDQRQFIVTLAIDPEKGER